MRLTKYNIKFVKESICNDLTYAYYVVMNDLEIVSYINHENNRTVVKEFKKEWLPKTVQTFIKEHNKKIFSKMEDETDIYIQYIYE